MTDPYQLDRFVAAQDDGSYRAAVAELRAGRKTSHWMWFIFPQVAGLGRSAAAQHFAISALDEAQAYLRHPVLGPRLRECVQLLAALDGKSADQILGSVDAMKLRSSLTLFMAAAPDEPLFRDALAKYFGGAADQLTLDRL
jgi:uncharacterized protein (DUF1810 family)